MAHRLQLGYRQHVDVAGVNDRVCFYDSFFRVSDREFDPAPRSRAVRRPFGDRGGAFPAVETNLVHYLFPVVAIVAGYVLFGEALPPLALVDFVLVAAGFGVLKQRTIVAELVN